MLTPSPALTIVLVSAIVGTIVFGLFPGPLISLTTSSLLPLP